MAKKIILLERLDPPGPGNIQVRAVFWADVPAARQTFYADPNRTSLYAAASAAELTALRNGSVVERSVDFQWPPGTTQVAMRNAMVAGFNTFQSEIMNEQRWSLTGSFWDGSSWTAGGA